MSHGRAGTGQSPQAGTAAPGIHPAQDWGTRNGSGMAEAPRKSWIHGNSSPLPKCCHLAGVTACISWALLAQRGHFLFILPTVPAHNCVISPALRASTPRCPELCCSTAEKSSRRVQSRSGRSDQIFQGGPGQEISIIKPSRATIITCPSLCQPLLQAQHPTVL